MDFGQILSSLSDTHNLFGLGQLTSVFLVFIFQKLILSSTLPVLW